MRFIDPHLTSPLQGEDIERFVLFACGSKAREANAIGFRQAR
jgi:hypothetical protein